MTLAFHPTTLAQILILEEIRQLVLTYSHRIDNGGGGDLADLFTEDGIWDSTDNGYPRLEGRRRIADFFGDETARAGRGHRLSHAVVGPVILRFTDTEIDAVCGFRGQALFKDRDDVVLDAGRYHDSYRRTADGWRIRSRRLEHVFPARLQSLDAAGENKPTSRSVTD
ncbi:MAG: nuclear transport factor 2 family protein [Microbacterium sp.]